MTTEFRSAPPDCKDCPLAYSRTQIVYPDVITNTPDKITIMFIGEAPGASEDKQGKPFVGKSGQLLREKIKELPGRIVITNTVKCRPPRNRDPRVKEKQACLKYLLKEISYYDPDLIILVGRHAAQTFLDKTVLQGFTHKTGTLYKDKYIPILHPASLLYNPGNKDKWEKSWLYIYETVKTILTK